MLKGWTAAANTTTSRLGISRGRGAKEEPKLGICGEHGGEAESVAFSYELGLDYVSCLPYRVPLARLAAARRRR
jgi:pyruvate, orthophosphate dikinase